MMLSRVAVDNLVDAVFEAVDLAGQGEIAEGYRVLVRGRQTALEGEARFEPWAEELEGRWNAALERYAGRYGIGRA